MTSIEIDTAMRRSCPVMYGGIRYDRIAEYVSWCDEKGMRHLSAVLLDRSGNCTVRVPADRAVEA